jgi:hypothetical protein
LPTEVERSTGVDELSTEADVPEGVGKPQHEDDPATEAAGDGAEYAPSVEQPKGEDGGTETGTLLSVRLSPEAAEAFESMMFERGSSLPETARDVIAIAWAIHRELAKDGRVFVERADSNLYELRFGFWLRPNSGRAQATTRLRGRTGVRGLRGGGRTRWRG